MATKKMNLGNLKTLEAKKFTQKKIIVDGYEILVDECFRETTMMALLKEVLEKSTYMKEKNIDLNLSDYSMILFMKHFTDLDIPEEFEKQIQFYTILIDLGYFEPIINAFPQSEINKFTERMKVYAQNMDKLIEDMKKETEVNSEIDKVELPEGTTVE